MDLITHFVGYIKNEKRYSSNTVLAYFNDISQFSEFLIKNFARIELKNASFRHVRSWIVSLMENSIEARSVNRKLSSLNIFYKFLIRENIVKFNPTEKIIPPKNKKRLPIFIEEKQMLNLTTNIDFGNGFIGLRNKLVITLLYGTGIRLSELISLKIEDIDFYENSIKVLGKRNKERIIPFGNQLKIELKQYIIERAKVNSKTNNVFVTEKGLSFYPKLVYRIVTHYIGMVATIEKKSPHILRHTFATHLLNNGADLNAIKELLGHANLAATQVYTHNSFEKLRNIYKKAHPRA
ncbi:MAG: integrase [Bacteroidetes bacterium CG02_land_8_20_14_3_00_31_25]|nr:tyrosine-type recombinase/integrase [Bacteroidota bacterium]PIV58616.1 MAG: integrase [Bacteroidetes bacterium CG02_land_8_20_14_3_00_31_25]PIX35493.1 MAG: integrase [Bacteroidetes bacterium CG_4_8_14_3_um_filter_31_14]PIY04397.1 MAG: integrase [Bacteroidetes bacterium CG_4_10_14_3_um_filter_31_20]